MLYVIIMLGLSIFPFGRKRKKVGLAFGGGGARGFAHIGAIRAFEESGVKFDYVSGCSAGSVAAAAYCSGMRYEEIYAAAKGLKKEDLLSSKLFFMPSDPKRVAETIGKILGDKDDFSKCVIPLTILSTDIVKGCEYVFENSGPISFAVSASCAVPGLFAPVCKDDKLLMDGGLLDNIPVRLLRERGCDSVVCVSVGDLSTPIAKSSGMIDVISASVKILIRGNSVKGKTESDVVIEPRLGDHKFNNLANIDVLIEAGYRAAMAKMPEIKELFR